MDPELAPLHKVESATPEIRAFFTTHQRDAVCQNSISHRVTRLKSLTPTLRRNYSTQLSFLSRNTPPLPLLLQGHHHLTSHLTHLPLGTAPLLLHNNGSSHRPHNPTL